MQQVTEWLETLGLGQYAQRFAENDIDASVLPHLTEDNLKELGISLGHRVLAASPIDASRAADGTRLLINGKTGKCLTIAGGTSPANNLAAVQFDCDGDLSRSWHLNSVGGAFQIMNAKTGKCLTIAGGTSPANNLEAVQFDCDSDPSRTWRLKD